MYISTVIKKNYNSMDGNTHIYAVSDDELVVKIKRNISRHWKKLARKLGFDETEIGAIEYNNPSDLEEQIETFFYKWKRKNGNLATKEVLLNAITSVSLPMESVQGLIESGVFLATSTQC